MHGASIVALTIYDMLKPIDKNVEISTVKLIEKKGGKSDFGLKKVPSLTIAVIVCSDSVSQGLKEHRAGKIVVEKLSTLGLETAHYCYYPRRGFNDTKNSNRVV